MPAFVAGFTAFFTGATVVGVAGTLGFIAAAAVFNAALGAIARKLTSKKGHETTGRSQPREVTVRATDAYDVFVYGRALVGGVTVYHNGIPDSNGVNNRMHHVVKWAGHECASISLFRLDDRRLDPSDCDWTPRSYDFTGESGLVTGGEFRGSTANSGPTYMRWYMGDQSSADARLNGQATEWTSSHVGHAQTYGILEIHQVDGGDQTSKVYQQGFPANIAALIHGKKVYDHRRYALNRDPLLRETNSWWSNGEVTPIIGLPNEAEVVEGIGGPNDHGVQVTDNDVSGEGVFTEFIPCDPSSSYTGFATMRRTIGDRPVIIQAQWFTADASSRITVDNVLSDQVPTVWSSYVFTLTPAASSALMRFGFNRISSLSPFTANTTQVQIQDMGVYLGTGSRHLANVSTTWEYSESPPFCVADYLTDERLGFGKRLRVPVNASRYARNGDPTWRRQDTLNVPTWWRTNPNSSNNTPLGSTASISLTQTSAPVGRRALVVAGSAGTGATGHDFFSEAVPIDPQGHYVVSVHARQDGGKAAFLPLAFLDSNGLNIPPSSGDATGWGGGTYHYMLENQPLASTWSNYLIAIGSGATASIPTSARFVSIGALCVRSFGTNGDTQQYFQEYQIHVGTRIRHFIEPHEQIFWPSVSSAAGYTDALVATPSGDQVRFSCNGAGHTGAGHRSNVRDLLSSFNGRCVYVQSGFHISAGWEEPTKTLNKSDFRKGGMKIRAKAEMLDRYNHVRGAFYDPDNEFKRVPTATVTAAEYIARDSSQQLFHDVFLPFTNDWYMAQRVAFGILEQGDNQQLVEFQLKHSALDLMPGKVVAINHDVVSWNNHTLRMVDMETDLKKGIKLYGREDYEASYVDVGTSEYFAREFNGVTSAAPIVPQVSSVSLTPRDNGVQLKWTNPAARSFEYIDIYRRTTNAFSGSTLLKSTRNDEHFDTLRAGERQFYWFQTRDFANNVSSVYPGLVSSFSAAATFAIPRDPHYVFLDEFRYQSIQDFQQKWEHNVGSGDITFPDEGDFGGKVLQSSGYTWWVSRIRIPFDPYAQYQMNVKVRQTGSVDANRALFAGFTGYRSDAVTPISTTSAEELTNQHFFVRNDQSLNSLDLWTEYTGYLRGHMPWPLSGTAVRNLSEDPKQAARMHDLTRYFSPTFVLNHEAGGGTAQIDYVSVRKLYPTRILVWDKDVTIPSNWLVTPALLTSIDLVNGALADFSTTAVDGEFNVAHMNGNAGAGSQILTERFNPVNHAVVTNINTMHFNWQALIYISSAANGGTIQPSVLVYTRHGSIAGAMRRPAALSIGSTVPQNQWAGISQSITMTSSTVNTNSYPPPYFISAGIQMFVSSFGGASPRSLALAYIEAGRGRGT